ncbi:2Fe-2S iron-sulfur cluster-binding protein, partial [Pseudaquidulcibacter saccharophilus]|uniref:2Fe-2S iron-sulfur cluster-binding protein n=1 Tax=Pseudaquidulcibacter saccharophilus TaxID=2831900 RepID=UPI001EFF230F
MTYTLTIEPLGEEIEVEEGQTVLDAALRAGIYLPHACGHGLCGTCKVDVLDGEVDHGAASPFALMDFERDEGKTLACECRLQSDVTIEADIDEDDDARRIAVKDFDCEVTAITNLTH